MYKKNRESINLRVSKTNNGKTILSKCAICPIKKLFKVIKKREASGILSNLGLKMLLNKTLSLGNILF